MNSSNPVWPAVTLFENLLDKRSIGALGRFGEPSAMHQKIQVIRSDRAIMLWRASAWVAPFISSRLCWLALQLQNEHSVKFPQIIGAAIYLSSGRSERLMRVTTASHARFSSCGYTKSKQCMEPRAERKKLHRL
jgi:hypothetical protein